MFNSLNHTHLRIHSGVWQKKYGSLWPYNVQTEKTALLNFIRRPRYPVVVTSDEGRNKLRKRYRFEQLDNSELTVMPKPEESTVSHTPPTIRLKRSATLRDGNLLRVSSCQTGLVQSASPACCTIAPTYTLFKRFAFKNTAIVPTSTHNTDI